MHGSLHHSLMQAWILNQLSNRFWHDVMCDFNNYKVGFKFYLSPMESNFIVGSYWLVVWLHVPGIHGIQHANPQGFPASYALVHFSSVGSGMV